MNRHAAKRQFAGARHAPRNPWTNEDVAELLRLWQAGRSAAEIGTLIGRPRNAVLGKIHRLRKEARKPSARATAPQEIVRAEEAQRRETFAKPAKMRKAPTKPKKPKGEGKGAGKGEGAKRAETGWRLNWNFKPPSDAVRARPRRLDAPIWQPEDAPEGARLVPLLDLTRTMCAWPYDGPDGKTLFCGCDVAGKTSWCATHRAMVFGGTEECDR